MERRRRGGRGRGARGRRCEDGGRFRPELRGEGGHGRHGRRHITIPRHFHQVSSIAPRGREPPEGRSRRAHTQTHATAALQPPLGSPPPTAAAQAGGSGRGAERAAQGSQSLAPVRPATSGRAAPTAPPPPPRGQRAPPRLEGPCEAAGGGGAGTHTHTLSHSHTYTHAHAGTPAQIHAGRGRAAPRRYLAALVFSVRAPPC